MGEFKREWRKIPLRVTDDVDDIFKGMADFTGDTAAALYRRAVLLGAPIIAREIDKLRRGIRGAKIPPITPPSRKK